MATLRKQIDVGAPPAAAWSAVREFGALHKRLVPGFVKDCVLEQDGMVRLLTFGNGLQVRERLVTRDDGARRLVYTTEGGKATHYNAVVEVLDGPAGGSRLVWTVDLLPDTLAPAIDGMMAMGAQAMQATLRAG